MATIKKRKDKKGQIRYQGIIRLKGFPTQTGTFKRKTDVYKWIQLVESSIRDGRHFKTSEAKKHTLSEMVDRYIEQFSMSKTKKQHLIWWKNNIGYYLLSDISPAHIAKCRDELSKGTTPRGNIRSPSTVVRYISSLSHVFTIGIKEYGWIDESPVSKITKPKEPQGRVRFLTDEERKDLIDACKLSSNKYLYIIVVIALSSGMRYGEIMNLKWKDVDLFKKQILLEKTKNKTRRAIPINNLAYELLKNLSNNRKHATDLLFPGNKIKKPMDIRKPWITALKKAKIEDFRFHDLRHSAASYLAMSGATLTEISLILGHKQLEMTKRYSHLSQKHISKVIGKMNEQIFG